MRKIKRGFKVPVIMDVPVEVEEKVDNDIDRDSAYLQANEDRKNVKWSNLNGNFRLIGDFLKDYLMNHFTEDISYEEISKELNINEGTVRQVINELATWSQYPISIIPTPKNKGRIQLTTRNIEDTDRWLTTQTRTVATKQFRIEKTERSVATKKVNKKKAKNKIRVENGN